LVSVRHQQEQDSDSGWDEALPDGSGESCSKMSAHVILLYLALLALPSLALLLSCTFFEDGKQRSMKPTESLIISCCDQTSGRNLLNAPCLDYLIFSGYQSQSPAGMNLNAHPALQLRVYSSLLT
jgi:hypothetical protein